MRKIRFVAIVLVMSLIYILPNVAFAHSKLVSSEPSDTSKKAVQEILLTFNEDIEPLSKVKVTNEAGEEQAITDTNVDGKVLKAEFEQPLTNGTYNVDWKVISEDGHPLNGSYSFDVIIEEPTPTPEPTGSNSSETSIATSLIEPEASATATSASTNTENSDESEDEGSLDLSTWAIILAAAILAAAVISTIVKKIKK